jgi:hypothetical protein
LVLSDEQARTLEMNLELYLEFARAAYLNLARTVKPSANLVDGTLSIDDLATRVLARLGVDKEKVDQGEAQSTSHV